MELIDVLTPIFNNNAEQISCFGEDDGEICINVSGGCIPYNYEILDNNTGLDITSELNGDNCLLNLAPGLYTITISDSYHESVRLQ